MTTPAPTFPSWQLACLCARWCRLCTGYEQVYEQACAALQASHPGVQCHWIDIEDEADLVGDLDVETFPTLVLAGRDRVLFAGALTPQPQTLLRVLRAALEAACSGQPPAAQPPAVQDFAARLWLRPAPHGAGVPKASGTAT